MQKAPENKPKESVVGASYRDPSGALVELILDREAGCTMLAVAGANESAAVEKTENEHGTTLVPVPAINNLIQHKAIVLPGPPAPFGDRDALLADIEAYVGRYVDLSPDFLRITSAYVLLSWLYDAFNELPYLRFRGDYGSGKTRALKVVGALTYKPLFASGASTISPIFHALDLFRGTLVIDESDFRVSDERAELTKILNQGNVRGFPVLRSQATPQKTFDPRAFHVFGPKLVAMRHSFDDQALESRFLTEEMGQRPLRSDIPINLPDCHEDEAYALRCKLLAFRFETLDATAIQPDCYDPSLSPRANQVMAPLLSVVPDQTLRESVLASMHASESAIAAERASSIEGQLVDVLVGQTWDAGVPISVGDIAEAFRRRHGREYDRPITPRFIGNVLRNRLHLGTVKRHGVFVLPMDYRNRVEALAERYGVSTATSA